MDKESKAAAEKRVLEVKEQKAKESAVNLKPTKVKEKPKKRGKK